jgi:hypothetical protein
VKEAIVPVTRRTILRAAGASAAFVTVGLPSAALATGERPPDGGDTCDFLLGPGGRQPVFLPPRGSTDPSEHSEHELLFWTAQLTEHGLFLAMLLPGAEAHDLRARSLQFHHTFRDILIRVGDAPVDEHTYRDVNRQVIDHTKAFVDFKLELEEGLRTGQIRGLVYPSFAAHVAAEGQHFTDRLGNINAGTLELDLGELVPFWARIMGEHALFAAHLLDPGHEAPLIEQARTLAAAFDAVGTNHDVAGLAAAGEMILDYKEAAEAGVESGDIQSIIHPALADHIRREAVKFLDELHRTID